MREPSLARWLRTLVYASALIPLVIFAQYVSPFHFGKVIVLRIVVEAMVVLYVLLAWRHPEYRPKGHPVTWAFFALTCAFTLTTVTSVSPLQSFWGTLERMGGLFTFWHYFAFYLIAVSVLRTKEHWRTLLDLMVAVGLVSALYGFLQKTEISFILGSGNRTRPFGTIGNPALFAGYQILVAYLAATLLTLKQLGPAAPAPRGTAERGGKLIAWGLGATLILALLAGPQGWWNVPLGLAAYGVYLVLWSVGKGWWFTAGGAALMFLAVASTAVRGSLLAVGVATIIAILLWSVLFRSRRGRTALIGALSAAALFFFLAILLRNTPLVQNSAYLNRITDFSGSTFTVKTRFWAWSAGLKGWSEAPRYTLVGWGPENFNIPFSKYFNPEFFTGPGAETFFDRAHNMFMEVLVTMGLAGELSYLALFGALFWTLSRFMRSGDQDLKRLGIGFTALTVAYIIHNCFIFDTSANFLTFFMLLAFVVHVAWRGMDAAPAAPVKQVARPWTAAQVTAAGVLGLVAVTVAWTTGVRSTMANYANTRGIIAGWQGDYRTAVAKYRESIDMHTPGRYEFRHRFAQYLLEMSSAANVEQVPGFNDDIAAAIRDVEANVAESPRDYLPLLYLSRLHILLGKTDPKSPHNDAALELCRQALEISPTFVRTYYEVAQAYLNKKDYASAYEWFLKARDLNPDVPVTTWYLGSVRVQQGLETGNTALVAEGVTYIEEALALGYRMGESDALRAAEAYLRLGRKEEVAQLYTRLVVTFPKKVLYWEQLAAVFIELNDRERLIETLQRALRVPEVAADQAFRVKAETTLRQYGEMP